MDLLLSGVLLTALNDTLSVRNSKKKTVMRPIALRVPHAYYAHREHCIIQVLGFMPSTEHSPQNEVMWWLALHMRIRAHGCSQTHMPCCTVCTVRTAQAAQKMVFAIAMLCTCASVNELPIAKLPTTNPMILQC